MNPELSLRDIHLPEPVSWWPLASGWWLLLALVVIGVFAVWILRRFKARRRLRTEALAELDNIKSAFAQHRNTQQLAADVSTLLRRICISRFPRHDVAGLSGAAWLSFLNRQADAFNETTARALIEAPYRPVCEIDSDTLLSACRTWIEQLNTGASKA